MDLGVLEKKTMELMQMPLNEQEEAILFLMKRNMRLENEIIELKERLARLLWSMEEHD